MIEFDDENEHVFDHIMREIELHPAFDCLRLSKETVLSLPGLVINSNRRKVYRDQQEVMLTTKEYQLLYLLAVNKGIVLTYDQIYQRIWGDDSLGNERNSVGCHVRNLKKKLYEVAPDPPFSILCVRDVGYCLEVDESETKSE